ncbi:AlpA family phage regulatory protein, partial [Salmonella enterica subsp. enterica serovar Typhimurium var. 5-]|nr:AlpA family phage regulatory protein [Salmonella enterica subsp. enterica serovar Typhimurium var. 5-]
DKTGLSRSTIYDWINPKSPRYDPTFPKQRRLGLQSVGWIEAEIDEWILQRTRAIE